MAALPGASTGFFGVTTMSSKRKGGEGSGLVEYIATVPVDQVKADTSGEAKSVLSDSVIGKLKSLGESVGQTVVRERGAWSGHRAEFVKITADFPRLDSGELDRDSAQMLEAREHMVPAMVAALVATGSYDRDLHKAGDNEFHVVSKDRPANYKLTGAAAVSMDRATLSKLPSLVEHPMGLRRFVESIRKTVDNTATKAWGRFFETDFVERNAGTRGAATGLADWLDGLSKPLIAKSNKARKDGLTVSSEAKVRAAFKTFCRDVLAG